MEDHTKEEVDSAKKILNLFVDLVENNTSAVQLYLAENIVLDWFGKTIKDSKKVSLFIRDQVSQVTHHIVNTYPSDKVAFRESHHVKVTHSQERPLFPLNNGLVTPPHNSAQASTSTTEIGQGDGIHNCPITSPPKKMRYSAEEEEDTETVEGEREISQLAYLTAEGTVEFHRPSIKKLQTETRWRRPVKLHIGYTMNGINDCTICLIIYEGNLKCRRNLYKEFCESSKTSG